MSIWQQMGTEMAADGAPRARGSMAPADQAAEAGRAPRRPPADQAPIDENATGQPAALHSDDRSAAPAAEAAEGS